MADRGTRKLLAPHHQSASWNTLPKWRGTVAFFNNPNFVPAITLYFQRLPAAFLVTLTVTGGAVGIGMALGLLLALAYLSPSRWLSGPAQAIIYVFRATPVPPFLYLIYFGTLTLFYPIEPEYAGMIGLGILLAPPMAELFRSGIQSVRTGLIEAGRALGMSRTLSYRRIILPIATRTMLPAIGQLTVGALLSSAFVAIIGAKDMTGMSRNVIFTYFSSELYLVLAATYFVIAFPISRALTALERRMQAYS
jgi:His/Glu/Gln/Arg/opine family amino acid ABC transporter permease subunit